MQYILILNLQTGFVKHLGKSGKCTVDETEKGWYITWIDRDPETIARQEADSKKEKLEKDDQEREAEFIRKQVERDRLRKGDAAFDEPRFTELQRTDSDEKIQLGLKLAPTQASGMTGSSKFSNGNVFKSSSKKYDSHEKSNGSRLDRLLPKSVSVYRKSSKQTRGSYSFSEGPNAGLIRILSDSCIFAHWFLSFLRALLECGSYSRTGLFRGFTICI